MQEKWDNNFSNKIGLVLGDEWQAGNLSYHLSSRPKWIHSMKPNEFKIDIINKLNSRGIGIIVVGDWVKQKNFCNNRIYLEIKSINFCMLGDK